MLTNCPECKGEVSDKATSCPRCGHPISAPIAAPGVTSAPPPRPARGLGVVVGLLLLVIVLLAVILVPGCLKDHARANLEAAPWEFVTGEKWLRYDKGIINTYTRATSIEFTNRSKFDVSEIAGKITYVSSSGEDLAVVPFTSNAEVRAGMKAMIGVNAGEISGYGATARIRVERVRVRQ